jgi:hypothetical protein
MRPDSAAPNKAGTATGKLDDKKILDGFIGMSLPWNRR